MSVLESSVVEFVLYVNEKLIEEEQKNAKHLKQANDNLLVASNVNFIRRLELEG